jgi:polysaccharide export outer membrane protein
MIRRFLLLLCLVGATLRAATGPESDSLAYRLHPLDLVSFSVHGETGLGASLRLSGGGSIRVPLLGDIRIAGLTLAEAEKKIQERYVAEEIFVRPQVTLQVTEYSKREVSVLGQISRQGKIEFPAEASSLDIVQVVTAAGGFSRIARADAVRVTRKDAETGEERVFTVNVERMLSGRSDEAFRILPGDVIFVPERLF